jgi:uncharacterized protein
MSGHLTTPLRVDPSALAPEVGFFRYGVVGGKVLLTNEGGEFHFLPKERFDTFLRGKIDGEERTDLERKGFFKTGLDIDRMAARIRRKKGFLGGGPHLHIVVTTLRCNHACKYCHASRTDMDRVDTDMSLATAREVVEFAFGTPSRVLNFEFQGGEPTANFAALKFIVEHAKEKNRYENRDLIFSLVTNLTLMDEEKMAFLVDNGVMVCTSLDGPEDLHNANRGWIGKSSSYQTVSSWMERFNQAWIDKGLDPNLFHVDALMTCTRASLGRGREIVDEYVKRGIKSIHLRPLNPFGFAVNTWKQIGYTMEEFLTFYRDTLDYILELNQKGIFIQERQAAMFLTKMLTPDDPNYTDCRSPSGSGSAQLAYNFDGSIYTCDEGRMVAHMGNDFFKLGHVSGSSYADIAAHPTVRALAVASIQEALPACADCVYKPTCGIQPLHNYMFDGDLFGQRPRSRKCQEFYGEQADLFRRLAEDTDGRVEKIFRRWTIQRSRPGTVPYPDGPSLTLPHPTEGSA